MKKTLETRTAQLSKWTKDQLKAQVQTYRRVVDLRGCSKDLLISMILEDEGLLRVRYTVDGRVW